MLKLVSIFTVVFLAEFGAIVYMTKAGDSPKDPGDVKITPEMIEAGVRILAGYEPGWVKGSDIVGEIYRSMKAAGSNCYHEQNQEHR